MSMTIEEMLAKINKTIADRNKRKLTALEKIKAATKGHLKTVAKYAPILRKLSSVVDLLARNHMLPSRGDYYDFLSDAWNHWIGYSNRSTQYWGVTGGGASGHSVFIDLKTKRFAVCQCYTEDNASVIWRTLDDVLDYIYTPRNGRDYDYDVVRHLNRMAEGVEAYIKRLEAHVEAIK